MPPDANEAADQGVGAAFSLDEYRRRRTPSTGGRPPAGGEPPVDLERRVAALEEALERIGGKLDKIIEAQAAARLAVEQRFAAVAETGAIRFGAIDTRLADISGKIDTKASATDVAGIKGRVDALPTTWQLITLVFGILGGAFLIVKFGLPHLP